MKEDWKSGTKRYDAMRLCESWSGPPVQIVGFDPRDDPSIIVQKVMHNYIIVFHSIFDS